MTRGLTEKQKRILEFLMEYVTEKGYPPSIREIGNQFNISSLRGVTVHLDALERKGMIKRANTSRSITIIGKTGATAPAKNVQMIPLIGTIAAGLPITANENIEGYIPVPSEMADSAEVFALQVKGDSMIGAHIMPRDFVVIRPQQTADNGDIVAVRLGEEATVKHIQFASNGIIKLIASNPAYDPIEVRREDSQIIGKVVGLIRNYDSTFVL